jgi:Na+/melibiose symporter-like transporter
VRQLLRHRDARLLLAGETMSMFGDRAMLLVLGIWVKSLTGSSAAAGLVFFAFTLPTLAAPLGGLVVDRVRRRPLMIATDCVIGVVVLSLLLVQGPGQLWLVYAVAILYGASNVIFASAQSALLTVMLPTHLLGDANSALQTVREGLRLVAPLAGAALFVAVGGASVAAIDAATFAVSAACLAGLRNREGRPPGGEHRFMVEVTAGLRHVWRTLALRQIVLASAVALLVVGFSETLVFAVVDRGLHRPPAFVGICGAVQGVGAIAGGLTAPWALRTLGDGRLVGAGLTLFAAAGVLLIWPLVPVAGAGFLVAGGALSWAIVGMVTAIQRRTPGALQGRAYAAVDSLTGTPQTVSIAVGAGLSTFLDYRVLLAVLAAVMAGAGLYLLTRKTFSQPAGE